MQELIEAGAVGFQIFREGPVRIIACLKEIQEMAGTDQADYGKLYTPLLTCLRERRKDEAFDELRHLVREFILDNFHIPDGTSILGELSHCSRVLTIGIAAKESDVPISLLNRQLCMVGAIEGKTSDNTISDRATLIPRETMDAAVAEVKKLNSFAVTRSTIGADRYTMERLCGDGVINLHFPPNDDGMPVFHEDEVIRFVHRLRDAADCGITQGSDHVPLRKAAARCHCTIAALLARALSGEFRLTSPLDAPFRLPDFYVNLTTLNLLLSEFPPEFVTAATAARLMGVKPGTIHALAEGEFLTGIMMDHRLANRAVRLFRHADIEVFANEYIVLRALSGTRKANFEETQRYIEENNIYPLPLIGDSQKIFQRTDIERIAYLPGGERLARLLFVDEARLHGLFSN
ncbi:hypothetical protein [Paenirhodobacter sp.]|uniref:hypothetical protein n=1 Tax=Paenirhodobacter sp. TaxID=1965326 RepID=UPI003B3FC196